METVYVDFIFKIEKKFNELISGHFALMNFWEILFILYIILAREIWFDFFFLCKTTIFLFNSQTISLKDIKFKSCRQMEIIYTLFKLFVLIQINQNQIIFPLKENIIIRKKNWIKILQKIKS